MHINFYGSIFDSSGYSQHSRNLVNALYKLNNDIYLECSKPLDWVRWVNDNELNMIANNKFKPDGVTIAISLPPSWPTFLALKPNSFVGFLVWEGDKIPEYWMKYLLDERINLIFVPSEHTKQAILNTIPKDADEEEALKCFDLIEKIKIVPHGVDLNVYYPEEIAKDDNFTFIANKGWANGINDRGGLQFLFKAYTNEFKQQEKVKLIAKINTVYNHPGWDLNNELLKLNLNSVNKPKFEIVLQNLLPHQLRHFYNSGDVFVNTTMADGFGLPPLEAMACGKPIITTPFGGQMDYLNDKNSILISKGEFVPANNGVLYEEVNWWKPDIQDIQDKLRYIFNHQEELKSLKNEALATSKLWTWEKSAELAMQALKTLNFN